MNITLMAFGSRGDVQPFLGLAVALRERGHSVTLAAPDDFAAQASAYGIPYHSLPLNAQQFSQQDATQRVMGGRRTPGALLAFWRELQRSLRAVPGAFAEAARGADLILAHGFLIPLAHAIHEHLQIPLVLGIAAPMVSTRAFPSPMFPPLPFGQRLYNPLTYALLVRGVIAYLIGPMNAYRKQAGLPQRSNGQMARLLTGAEFPVLMHYSRHLQPVPADWGANAHVTGAWPLPAPANWTPPDALTAFLAQGEPPVFLGFGSITVPNPEKMAQTLGEALRLANLRGVLQAGWAGLAHQDEHLITIGDAPHEWLFPRMAAIVHHGGSGTTHSAAAAGKPALIIPYMADQPFWARRLVELGVGVPPIAPKRLTAARLAAALRALTEDAGMRQRAAELGALLRAEDGLAAACEVVEKQAA